MDDREFVRDYAVVTWTAADVQTLRPNWGLEQCEEWLADNEHHIQSRLTEVGWECIQALLDFDGGN